MKKTILLLSLALSLGDLSAKKVKFSVDMSGQTVSSNGVHITGDFQAAAGLGPDWDPGTALMSQEGNTTIYSLIVNIPAFKKYEYRILNGDQTYDSEFVPDESRVGYDMVDNRWLYVDSLSNDTTITGNILFGGNAPSGKFLVRYKVDMRLAGTVSNAGVHLGTSYQPTVFNPAQTRLYSFTNGIYEIIQHVSGNTYAYVYYNGNTAGATETVPSACSTNSKRSITVTQDVVLPEICFSSCAACVGVGISENAAAAATVKLYPNPASNFITIESDKQELSSYCVKDVCGREIMAEQSFESEQLDVSGLKGGIYFIYLKTKAGQPVAAKFVIE